MITFEEYENALKQRHGERIYNILSHSSVAIAGLGGLGSNIAMYLARAGVGHLHLVDFDKVDITNLNRQQYDIADLGTLKTDALTKNIKRFNPFIEITSQCVKVNEDNAAEIFGGYKIVCEAFDKAENKAMLVNSILSECGDTKIVSGSGMAGFGSSNTIVTRKINDRFYLCGDTKSDMNDGLEFTSRFILGSGKYSLELIKAAVENAGAEIITLALRRAAGGDVANILDYIPKGVTLLPNTSGARNADEAVRIARLARETGCGDFIKIEAIRDTKYLLPDNYETLKATEILAKEGFVVMPYMYPDLNFARDLQNAGAACIMPLGSPIGSNKGLCTKEFIKILIDEIDLPIIVDAGIGRPSQACEAMEMGAAAVMANTAIATAGDVPKMAQAFKKAIEAGRESYLAGFGDVVEKGARASSPLTGFLHD